MKITARITRGKNAGKLLHPHLHKDGMYVVSKTRFEKDYIRLEYLHEIASHIAAGYSLRMSNQEEGVLAASLINPTAISVTV